MVKIVKVSVIGENRTYKNPESIYDYVTDPNSEEAFVITKDEQDNYNMEILTDFIRNYKIIKNSDGIFAIKI